MGNDLKYRQGVIILLKKDNSFLLARKTGSAEWNFPAGGQEQGESVTDTFYRELAEELGLQKDNVHSLRISRVTHKYEWNEKFKQKTGYDGQEQHIVIAEFTGNIELSGQDELEEVRFVKCSELLRTLTHKDLQETVKKMVAQGELKGVG